MAAILVEHVQQIIDLTALTPQLPVKISQSRGGLVPRHLGAGEAVHQVVQVFVAGQPRHNGGQNEERRVMVAVLVQVFQDQVRGPLEVFGIGGVEVTPGHQGPLLQAQIGKSLQFLAGQLQGLGQSPGR